MADISRPAPNPQDPTMAEQRVRVFSLRIVNGNLIADIQIEHGQVVNNRWLPAHRSVHSGINVLDQPLMDAIGAAAWTAEDNP